MRLTRNRLRRALRATEGWKGCWWDDRAVTDVLDAAGARGFTRRMSVTQVQLTDAGAAWLKG